MGTSLNELKTGREKLEIINQVLARINSISEAIDNTRLDEVVGLKQACESLKNECLKFKNDIVDKNDDILSKYDDISEIYLISDICITDYSSVFFDFANLKRPVLFYTYDIEKYKNQLRGFYIDMNTEVPGPLLYTSEEVVNAILNIDQINEEYKERYEEFYKRFCCYDDGNASKHIVEEVFK